LPGKLAQLRSIGLPMAIGSDAGSPLHFQAGAIWWELEAWRAAGASHREALTAATVHAAQALRTADVGRLAVGSRADFVLYRGNAEAGAFEQARVLAVGKGAVLYVADGRWIGPPVSAAR
jgi:imidazolonepropionase-like amidohydrolase